MVMYLLVTCASFSVCTFGHLESVPFGSAAVGKRNWTKSVSQFSDAAFFHKLRIKIRRAGGRNEYENQYTISIFPRRPLKFQLDSQSFFYTDSNNNKISLLKNDTSLRTRTIVNISTVNLLFLFVFCLHEITLNHI